MFDPEAPPLEWDTKQEYTRGGSRSPHFRCVQFKVCGIRLCAIQIQSVWDKVVCNSNYVGSGCSPRAMRHARLNCTVPTHLAMLNLTPNPNAPLCLNPVCTPTDKVELYYLTKAGKPLSRDQLVMVLAKGVWPEGWSDSGPVM